MKKLFSLVLLSLAVTTAQAAFRNYDFSAVNAEGQTLYYKIQSGDTTCELVGESYFYQLKDVVVPEYVSNGNKQFQVTRIGENAFNSSPLETLSLPASIREIGSAAFAHTSMRGIELPANIQKIEAAAFTYSKLERIEWPDKVAVIEENTFDCSGLQYIKIPATVQIINRDAFAGCLSLSEAHFSSLEHLLSIDFNGIDSNPLTYTGRLLVDGQEIFDLEIPEGITELPFGVFSNCKDLTSVTFPTTLAKIGQWAFRGCTGLTNADYASIEQMCNIEYLWTDANPVSLCHHFTIRGEEVHSLVIPESVTSIGNFAFWSSESIISVVVPNSVKSIGYYAFKDCVNMKTLTLGCGITDIGEDCFAGCKLRDIEILAATPPAIAASTFSGQSQHHTTLFVPIGSFDNYAYDDTYWYLFNAIHENAVKAEELSTAQAYMLKNSESRSYMVYDQVNDDIHFVELDADINMNEPNHGWQVIKENGHTYIYNIGASQYLKIDGEGGMSMTLEKTPVSISDGKMGVCLGGELDWLFVLNNCLSVRETSIEEVQQDKSDDEMHFDIFGRKISASSSKHFMIKGHRIVI